MEIRTIRVPRNVVQDLPRPVVSNIRIPKPVTTPPPVVRGLLPPVVNVPDTSIEYPIIDVPTEEQFRGDMSPSQETPVSPAPDTRDLPIEPIVTVPSFEVGGIVVPIPDPAPIAAAGVMAIATTVAALGTTVLFTQVKSGMDPVLKKIAAKKKVKVKKTKTVLHFIPDDNSGNVEVLEYSTDGVKIVDDSIENLEQYLRDQVDINSFYEYDNKIIIDDIMKKNFSKEGAKRFGRHFASPKSIAKKLGAKFSF